MMIGLALCLLLGWATLAARSVPQKVPALHSALHFQPCSGGLIVQPMHTSDVAEMVGTLYREHQARGTDYLVRSSHQNFYTHNNMSCTGDMAASVTTPIMLDMSRMDLVLDLDMDKGTISVQAGMTVEALEEALLRHGLSLPGWGTTPPYAGMSLGAAIDYAVHGSSLVGAASLASHLQAAVLVDGRGDVLPLDAPAPLLEGSLGLLGVVTELTLRVEAGDGGGSARRSAVTELVQEDTHMLDDMRRLVEESGAQAMVVTWSPAAGLYAARVWEEAHPDVAGDAMYGHVVAPPEWLENVEGLLAQDQEEQQGSAHSYDLMCEIIGDLTTLPAFAGGATAATVQGPTATGDDGEKGDAAASGGELPAAAVGWANRMGSARCVVDPVSSSSGDESAGCLWRRAKVTPHTLAIDSGLLDRWLDDVRAVLASTVDCPSLLFHLRFVMDSPALLAASTGKQVVSIDIQSISSLKYNGLLPIKHQDLLDEVLQLSLCKYHARPHWALSTNRMLVNGCGARNAWPAASFDRLAERQQRYDPAGLFLHPLFVRVASNSGPVLYPGCALKEDCFCESDVHCGPGFRCAPAHTFPEYKVCRMWGNENPVDEL